jgi:hypothetical protein
MCDRLNTPNGVLGEPWISLACHFGYNYDQRRSIRTQGAQSDKGCAVALFEKLQQDGNCDSSVASVICALREIYLNNTALKLEEMIGQYCIYLGNTNDVEKATADNYKPFPISSNAGEISPTNFDVNTGTMNDETVATQTLVQLQHDLAVERSKNDQLCQQLEVEKATIIHFRQQFAAQRNNLPTNVSQDEPPPYYSLFHTSKDF